MDMIILNLKIKKNLLGKFLKQGRSIKNYIFHIKSTGILKNQKKLKLWLLYELKILYILLYLRNNLIY